MALNFPDSPTNNQVFTDGTGEQWRYNSADNSWTSLGLTNAAGIIYKGSVDITAAPPAGVQSGWQYTVSTGGTANAGYGPGITGAVVAGSVVLFDGTRWVTTTSAIPSATASVAGIQTKLWKRTGTTLAPETTGDSVDLGTGSATVANITATSLAGAGTIPVAVDNTGKLIKLPQPFTWDANTDTYTRVAVADRDISAQARMRRCLLTDAGVVTYLDADDSTKLAGDWLRLCETAELSAPNTGTFGAEAQNTRLRELATAWAAGTYTKGAVVTNGGSVWECVAATTTATPAAGTVAATLTGTAGQVMVEIPLFSVRHVAEKVGTYSRHEHAVALGEVKGGGFQVHPAFVKPDGTLRNFIYIGAYKGTGANGNGSASGVNNAVSFTRAAARTAMKARGTGWHQYSYWQWNAIQHLYLAEYQDMNSQRVLGDGSMAGATYSVNTGLSNARGNRCGHVTGGTAADYMSYRGVENFYGRAWDWIDGINVNERMVYLCGDPSKFADDTVTGYTPLAMVPSGSGSYQRDVMPGLAMLPSSVAGASATTYVGDALWTNVGWRVASVGGSADHGAPVGGWYVHLHNPSSDASTALGSRLAYAA